MKITIEITLAEQDLPPYSARINHALSGLLHEAHTASLRGDYVFVYPASDFDRIAAVPTTVRVTQED